MLVFQCIQLLADLIEAFYVMKILRAAGQSEKYGLFGVTGIEFCCGAMAEDILFGRVKTTPWTDHPLIFSVGDYQIKHCGHCGEKIDDEAYS